MSTARIFPCHFQHIYCDVFMCYSESKWWVGLPDGPEGSNYMLCDSCAKAMFANPPEELVPEEQKALMWQETAEIPVKRKGKAKPAEDQTE